MTGLTQAERIASLETEVSNLTLAISGMNGKLDDLLALKNKGAGVFWLFSAIIGSGMIGLVLQLIGWFRNG